MDPDYLSMIVAVIKAGMVGMGMFFVLRILAMLQACGGLDCVLPPM
jgi:hypothetical protein